MPIKDLASAANLYETYNLIVSIQNEISLAIERSNQKLIDAWATLESNPLFQELTPEEKAYPVSLVDVVLQADTDIKAIKEPAKDIVKPEVESDLDPA